MRTKGIGWICTRFIALALLAALASMGCEEQQKSSPPKETAQKETPQKQAAEPKKEQPAAGNPVADMGKAVGDMGKAIVDGTGKVLEGTGKVIVEGGGKLLEGTGKVVIEGGGKVVDEAGKVIGGAGVAIGKAVGDVVVVTLGPDTSAPPFTLADLYGKRLSLSDYKGSPVVLLFCTTNYAPCVVEMRHLRDLQEKYANDGLKVIAIAMDWEGPASLRSFLEKMDLNYPILWDKGTTFKEYTSLSRVPATFFIDRKGNIWKKRIGFRSATIITSGGQMIGTSMVEMDRDFERDVVELLKK